MLDKNAPHRPYTYTIITFQYVSLIELATISAYFCLTSSALKTQISS